MKKIITLALATGLLSLSSPLAQATEFTASGFYTISGQYADGLDFIENGGVGGIQVGDYNSGGEHDTETGFSVYQRVQFDLGFVASPELSGHMTLRAPARAVWGASDIGGFDIGGSTEVQIKSAYVDWLIPGMMKVRMGLQPMALPAYSNGSNPVLDDYLAGVSLMTAFNDNIHASLVWGRAAYSSSSASCADFFALVVPMTYENFSFIPWGTVALGGKHADYYNELVYTPYQLVPTGQSDNYTAYILGFTSSYTYDKLTLELGTIYAANTLDYYNLNRDLKENSAGWLLDLSLSYATDYGTPALFGWYASGDNKEGEIGRFVTISGGWGNGVSGFFEQSSYGLLADSGVDSPAGTWGAGLKYSGFKPMDKLTMGGHVMYVAGTNAKENAGTTGNYFTARYLTTEDSLVELAGYAIYDIYKDFQVGFEINYIFENMDQDLWNEEFTNGFRTGVSFKYSF